MSNLAQIIDSLSPEYQREAESYLLYLKQQNDRERQRFVAAVNEGLEDSQAGRVISDAAFKAELEAEFGPLSD